MENSARYQSPVRRLSAGRQQEKLGSPELSKLKSLLKGRAKTAAADSTSKAKKKAPAKKNVTVKLNDGTMIKLCSTCADKPKKEPAKRQRQTVDADAETAKKPNLKSNAKKADSKTNLAGQEKKPRAKKDTTEKTAPKPRTMKSKLNQKKDESIAENPTDFLLGSKDVNKSSNIDNKKPAAQKTSRTNKNKSSENMEDKENLNNSFKNISMTNVDDFITDITKELNETVAKSQAETSKPTRKRAAVVTSKAKGTAATRKSSEKPRAPRKKAVEKNDNKSCSPEKVRQQTNTGEYSSDANLSSLLQHCTHSTSLEDNAHNSSGGCSFSKQETLKIKPNLSIASNNDKTIKKESTDYSNITLRSGHTYHSKCKNLSNSRLKSQEVKGLSKSLPKNTEKLDKSVKTEKSMDEASAKVNQSSTEKSKPKLLTKSEAKAAKQPEQKDSKKDKEARRKHKNDRKVAKAMDYMSRYFSRTSGRVLTDPHLSDLSISDSDDSDLSMCSSSCSCQCDSTTSSECNCWECEMRNSSSDEEMTEYTLTDSSSSDSSNDRKGCKWTGKCHDKYKK